MRAAPVALLGCLAAGLIQSALGDGAIPGAPLLAAAGGVLALVLRVRSPALCLVALALALVAAGSAWGGARVATTATAPLAAAGEFAGSVRVTAPPGAGQELRLTARVLHGTVSGRPLTGSPLLIVELPPAAAAAESGTSLRLRGRLRPAGEEGPGWWRGYLERRGISGELAAQEAVPLGASGASLRERWRGWAQGRISARVGGERGAVVRGLALGGGSGLSETTAQEFRDAGIWHLLAVSGQNVTAVALAVLAALSALAVPTRVRLLVAALAVVVYVLACDAGPSVGRAAAVGLLVLATQFAGRARSPWYALTFALVILLAYQPRAIEDPGLHLSFVAVAGLFLLSPGIDALARGWMPRPLAVLLGASLGAGLATAPVLAWHFERLSLVGIAVNVIAVPLAAPVVVLALIGLAADALAAGMGRPFAAAAAAGAQSLMWMASGASSLPLGAVDVPAWSAVPLAGAAAGVFAALRAGWGGILARAATAVGAGWVVLALVLSAPPSWPTSPELTVLDVGQGQAVLLRDPGGATTLIDVGPPGAPAPLVGALRRHGVRRIDLLVLTHGARDQAGAVSALSGGLRPARAVHGPFGRGPGEADGLGALALLRAEGVPTVEVAAGDRRVVGGWALEVLWPPPGAGLAASANDRSLVLVARAPGLSVLIASDAEGDVLLRAPLPRVDALIVSHHGSRDDLLASVLERVRPALAAISVGEGNRHGHPAPSTLAALSEAGIPTRRTDLDGDVAILAPTSR